MKMPNKKREDVIQGYKTGQSNQSELARRHGLCAATVSNWVREAGCPTGSRGRPAHKQPTSRQQEMLRRAWANTYAVAALRFGVSKQYLSQLAKRWQDWAEHELGPRRSLSSSVAPKVKSPKRAPRIPSPNVISFRIPDSALAKIVLIRGNKNQFLGQSLHIVARELLLAGIGQGYGSALSVGEPTQTEIVSSAN